MALPEPEETVMGITAPKKKRRAARPVLAPIERRDPPKVAGITEFVGTQRPTEQQKPEKPVATYVPTYQEYMDKKYGKGWEDGITIGSARQTEADYDAQYGAKARAAKKEFNESVKTYNKAIGYLDPAADKAAAKKMLKRTGVKTVMS